MFLLFGHDSFLPAIDTMTPRRAVLSDSVAITPSQITHPLSPLESTLPQDLTSVHSKPLTAKAKLFTIRTYKKRGGAPLPSLRLLNVQTCRRENIPTILRSFLLFSDDCALFCIPQNVNSFVFNRSHTLSANHPGWACLSLDTRHSSFAPLVSGHSAGAAKGTRRRSCGFAPPNLVRFLQAQGIPAVHFADSLGEGVHPPTSSHSLGYPQEV